MAINQLPLCCAHQSSLDGYRNLRSASSTRLSTGFRGETDSFTHTWIRIPVGGAQQDESSPWWILMNIQAWEPWSWPVFLLRPHLLFNPSSACCHPNHQQFLEHAKLFLALCSALLFLPPPVPSLLSPSVSKLLWAVKSQLRIPTCGTSPTTLPAPRQDWMLPL